MWRPGRALGAPDTPGAGREPGRPPPAAPRDPAAARPAASPLRVAGGAQSHPRLPQRPRRGCLGPAAWLGLGAGLCRPMLGSPPGAASAARRRLLPALPPRALQVRARSPAPAGPPTPHPAAPARFSLGVCCLAPGARGRPGPRGSPTCCAPCCAPCPCPAAAGLASRGTLSLQTGDVLPGGTRRPPPPARQPLLPGEGPPPSRFARSAALRAVTSLALASGFLNVSSLVPLLRISAYRVLGRRVPPPCRDSFHFEVSFQCHLVPSDIRGRPVSLGVWSLPLAFVCPFRFESSPFAGLQVYRPCPPQRPVYF